MGYRVKLGVDGRNALSLLVEEMPDLVISDIEMPRMDGFELLYAMKNDERFSGIPVILVTSRDSDNDRRKDLTPGASDYIVKPLRAEKRRVGERGVSRCRIGWGAR